MSLECGAYEDFVPANLYHLLAIRFRMRSDSSGDGIVSRNQHMQSLALRPDPDERQTPTRSAGVCPFDTE